MLPEFQTQAKNERIIAELPRVERQEARHFRGMLALLIRQKAGELPWLVRALMRYMVPVQVVSVVGMANALWRLGHERFDAILLDVKVADRAVVDRCREQIADIAAVPVLNLHDGPSEASAGDQRPRPGRKRDTGRAMPPIDHHEVARLPWERRAKRQARKAEQAASVA
jgi:hypothetical protein